MESITEALREAVAARTEQEARVAVLEAERDRLERLYQEATAALRAHEDLLAIVSHDLRNPLNNIFLNLGVLARSVSSVPAERRRDRSQIALIKQSAGRLNRLVHDLVTATTLEAGHLTARLEPEAIATLLDDARRTLEPLVIDRGLSLRVEGGVAPMTVLCDRDRMLQVFENLFSHAMDGTPRGGVITLSVERAEGLARFAVADTGAGIAADDLPFVFERYWKQAQSPTHSVGLALSIVKGIIETHGGRVWVASELGRGSTFFFTLQLVP